MGKWFSEQIVPDQHNGITYVFTNHYVNITNVISLITYVYCDEDTENLNLDGFKMVYHNLNDLWHWLVVNILNWYIQSFMQESHTTLEVGEIHSVLYVDAL